MRSRPPPSRLVSEVDPEALTALRIGAYSLLYLDRVPDFAAVDTAVELVKEAGAAKAAGFVNGVLRTIARRGRQLLPPTPHRGNVSALALFRSHPEWWTRRLVDRLGWDRADALLAANNLPASTVLGAVRRPGGSRASARVRRRRRGPRTVRCRRAACAFRRAAADAALQGRRVLDSG